MFRNTGMFLLHVLFVVATMGFVSPGFMPQVCAQEIRLFDQTFTATEEEHGFHFFNVDSSFSGNWLEPFNYFEGTFQLRYEIINYPGTDPFRLSVCIWSDVKSTPQGKWEHWRETSSPQLWISGRGVFTTFTSPSTWWQIHEEEPVDFARAKDFLRLGIVYWCSNHKNLSDWVPEDGGCWPQRNSLLPMKMRVTIVAVAKGYEFSGWN